MILTPAQRNHWRQRWAGQAAGRELKRGELRSQAGAIAAELRRHWPPISIWLFGSVLGSGLHADSDLDLAVEGLAAGELLDALALAERSAAAAADRTGSATVAVDLVRLEALPIHWQERIRAEGPPLL